MRQSEIRHALIQFLSTKKLFFRLKYKMVWAKEKDNQKKTILCHLIDFTKKFQLLVQIVITFRQTHPVLNPNSVLYLGSPDDETVDILPLPPVEFLSRDSEPPVDVTFNTDIVRRLLPKNVGESGADCGWPSLLAVDSEEGLPLRWKIQEFDVKIYVQPYPNLKDSGVNLTQ